MEIAQPDRFVRLPTELVEALLQARFSRAQWRLLFWVIRQTFGWNRSWTLFTWYGIAKELSMDRPGVYRAGRGLLRDNVLAYASGRLAVQMNRAKWNARVLTTGTVVAKQRWITARDTLSGNNESVVSQQRNRCQRTTLFRRAKDRCKDRKTVVGARSVDNHGERRIYEGTDQHPTPVEQLMDHYIVLNSKAMTKRQTAAFYQRFRKSAEALLGAYAQNVQDAKEAVSKIVRGSQTEQ